jgi:ABC-2 type transport system permease protein
LSRELVPFLLRVGMQPLLFLFVFTSVMPHMSGRQSLWLRGWTGFGTGPAAGIDGCGHHVQRNRGVALPLSTEFGITREIDDRVMCPVPVGPWRRKDLLFGDAVMVAALLVIPLAIWIPAQPVYPEIHNWFLFVRGVGAVQPAGRGAGIDDRVECEARSRLGWFFR